jgi:hypothetical protein
MNRNGLTGLLGIAASTVTFSLTSTAFALESSKFFDPSPDLGSSLPKAMGVSVKRDMPQILQLPSAATIALELSLVRKQLKSEPEVAPVRVRAPVLSRPETNAAPVQVRAPVSSAPLAGQSTQPVSSSSREVRILGIRLPAFIALSLGGLGAGGAIATRIAAHEAEAKANGNDPRTCDSRCTDRSARSVDRKALLVTSGILSGVAAAGVGVGVALIIGQKDSERAGPVPSLGFGLSTSKAVAKANWHF